MFELIDAIHYFSSFNDYWDTSQLESAMNRKP